MFQCSLRGCPSPVGLNFLIPHSSLLTPPSSFAIRHSFVIWISSFVIPLLRWPKTTIDSHSQEEYTCVHVRHFHPPPPKPFRRRAFLFPYPKGAPMKNPTTPHLSRTERRARRHVSFRQACMNRIEASGIVVPWGSSNKGTQGGTAWTIRAGRNGERPGSFGKQPSGFGRTAASQYENSVVSKVWPSILFIRGAETCCGPPFYRTEILKSSCGLYKQLEGQHAKRIYQLVSMSTGLVETDHG